MPYDPKFLPGHTLPLPRPNAEIRASSFDDGKYVHHTRYSLLFNKERGLAFCSAHNIDGATLRSTQLTNRSFKADPKIMPRSLQIENNRGYKHNSWDRGHLARRKSMSWGTEDTVVSTAERESDYYSNIVPQHENLHDDAWGKIEDWMLEKSLRGSKKACVFTGPVFTTKDPKHHNAPNEHPIQIPAGYWKVIAVPDNNDVKSASFLVWQRDYNSLSPLPFAPILEQVRLTTIEVLTGLSFHDLGRKDVVLLAAKVKQNRVTHARTEQSFGSRMQNMFSRRKPSTSPGIISASDIIF